MEMSLSRMTEVTAIGSGGPYAHAAAKALTDFSNRRQKPLPWKQ